jgi:hypothetical protein
VPATNNPAKALFINCSSNERIFYHYAASRTAKSQ